MRRSLTRALFASALIVSSSVAATSGPGLLTSSYGGGDRYATIGDDRWASAPMPTRERESWLESRIEHKMSEGQLDDRRGRNLLRKLNDIVQLDESYRQNDGRLNEDQRRDILARLDAVRGEVGGDL